MRVIAISSTPDEQDTATRALYSLRAPLISKMKENLYFFELFVLLCTSVLVPYGTPGISKQKNRKQNLSVLVPYGAHLKFRTKKHKKQKLCAA